MSRRRRNHAPSSDPERAAAGWTLCGDPAGNVADPVTCKRCLRKLAAMRSEIVDRSPYTPKVGARHIDESTRAALERPPQKRYRWKNAAAAVRAYVRMRDEGASLRSTCDPDRANRVQVSRDASLGGREHDAIERCATVARALGLAMRYPLAITAACPVVTPRQALDIYLLALCGYGRRVEVHKRKGFHRERVRVSDEWAAQIASDRSGLEVTSAHVRAIRWHFDEIVRAELVASGEVAPAGAEKPRKRRGSFGADPGGRLR